MKPWINITSKWKLMFFPPFNFKVTQKNPVFRWCICLVGLWGDPGGFGHLNYICKEIKPAKLTWYVPVKENIWATIQLNTVESRVNTEPQDYFLLSVSLSDLYGEWRCFSMIKSVTMGSKVILSQTAIQKKKIYI